MKKSRIVWFIALLVFAPTIDAADSGGEIDRNSENSILIEVDQLQRKLKDSSFRVLDVRSPTEYAQGHIPGAVRVDVAEWKSLAASEGGFRDAIGWANQLGQVGLQKDMHVAVYGGKLSDSARIWWLLKYVGVNNASILNGGWEWWVKQARPVETSAANVPATEFEPDFQADRLMEIDSLTKSLNATTMKVVDTRSDGEFTAGRIPGATHLEWKELIAEDGRFKATTQLQQLFRNRGIVPSHTAVCY